MSNARLGLLRAGVSCCRGHLGGGVGAAAVLEQCCVGVCVQNYREIKAFHGIVTACAVGAAIWLVIVLGLMI
ncbi:MAG: hypothetical protein ACR2QB_09855 [Gammaproteobacteria bacterium]